MTQGVAGFQGALGQLAIEAGNSAKQLVSRISSLSPAEGYSFITDAYPEIIEPFISASGEMTAQWYHENVPRAVRRAASVFTPEPSAIPDRNQIAASARWALSGGSDNPAERLGGASTRYVFDESRRTVRDNAKREGVKFTRHASSNACGFCRMLATRVLTQDEPGAPGLYVSRATARRNAHKFDDVRGHDHCKCLVVPVRAGYEPPSYVYDWMDDYYAVNRDGDGALRREWNIAYRMERRAAERTGGGGARKARAGRSATAAEDVIKDVIDLDDVKRDAGGQFVGNRKLFQRNSARAAEIAKSARDQVAAAQRITSRVDSYAGTASQVTGNIKRVTDFADKTIGAGVPIVRDIKRAVDAADKATSSAAKLTGGVNRTVALADTAIRDTERIAQGAKELVDDVKSVMDDAAYLTVGIKQLLAEAGDITDIAAATGLRGRAIATAGKASQLTDRGLDLIDRAKGTVSTVQNYPAKVADIPNVLRAPLLDVEKLVRSAQATPAAAHQAAVDASDLADSLRALVDNVIDYRRNGFTETYNRTAAWTYSERVTDELGSIIGGRIPAPKPIGSVTPPTWVRSERLELPAPPRRLELTAGAPVSQVDDVVAEVVDRALPAAPTQLAIGAAPTEVTTATVAANPALAQSIYFRDSRGRVVGNSLGLSTRLARALERGGVETVGDLVNLTADDLMDADRFPTKKGWTGAFGPKSVDEIISRLADEGLSLKPSPKKQARTPKRTLDDIEADFSAAIASGADDDIIDRLASEMAEAETAQNKLAANRARAAARRDAADAAKYDRMSQMIEDGVDPIEAEAKAFGISEATVRSRTILSQARNNGYPNAKSVEDVVKQVFMEKASESYFAAEQATRGKMLKTQYELKVDPADLWFCTEKQARTWMSEEMAAWFDANGRITRAAVRGMIVDGDQVWRNPLTEDFLQ